MFLVTIPPKQTFKQQNGSSACPEIKSDSEKKGNYVIASSNYKLKLNRTEDKRNFEHWTEDLW